MVWSLYLIFQIWCQSSNFSRTRSLFTLMKDDADWMCSRKNCKPLFSAGIVLLFEFWNYTFHPIRTTHAILPRHTLPGTIKGSAKHVWPLFSFLVPFGWQKARPADTRENISLSNSGQFQQQTGTIHLERAHFNICSSAYLRRPFPGQLFLPPKPNGPDASG